MYLQSYLILEETVIALRDLVEELLRAPDSGSSVFSESVGSSPDHSTCVLEYFTIIA